MTVHWGWLCVCQRATASSTDCARARSTDCARARSGECARARSGECARARSAECVILVQIPSLVFSNETSFRPWCSHWLLLSMTAAATGCCSHQMLLTGCYPHWLLPSLVATLAGCYPHWCIHWLLVSVQAAVKTGHSHQFHQRRAVRRTTLTPLLTVNLDPATEPAP